MSTRFRPQQLALFGVLLVTVGAILLQTGCFNVYELDFARDKPSTVDLVGRWVPTPASVKTTESSGHRISMKEFNLKSDGSFSVVGLPTSPDLSGASIDGSLSGTGVWRLDKLKTAGDTWAINLIFASHVAWTVHIQRQRPPYLINIGLGDPDAEPPLLLQRVP